MTTKHKHVELNAVEREAAAWISAQRRGERSGTNDQSAEELVHAVIETAHGHVGLRVNTIASLVGLNTRSLEKRFRVRYGTTMQRFANAERMRFAQQLFAEDPAMKIDVVAIMLGYRHSSDFSQFFRTHETLGERPSIYRNRLRGSRERD